MTDSEGPGVRAERALSKRWLVFGGVYAVVATVFVVGLMMGRRDPAAGFPPFTPEAGVAGAVLLPALTLVTMWAGLRLADEFQRRLVVDSWAAGFIVTVLGTISWGFLIAGGVVPEPPGRAWMGTVMLGGGVAVMVALLWLKWRRS
jgi:hypothetical protein